MSQARLPRTEPSTELITAHKVNTATLMPPVQTRDFSALPKHRAHSEASNLAQEIPLPRTLDGPAAHMAAASLRPHHGSHPIRVALAAWHLELLYWQGATANASDSELRSQNCNWAFYV